MEGDHTRSIALDSDAIMLTEEKCGVLLKKLDDFHELLIYNKDDITLERIWMIEEQLK